MIQSIPQIGTQKPKLVDSFGCYTYVIVQVTTANTLYIAETDNALTSPNDFGVIDALLVNLATGIFRFWWKGDLWVAGDSPFNCIIGISGVNTGSGLRGSSGVPANVLAPSSGGTL
jgi:hypothetical protein